MAAHTTLISFCSGMNFNKPDDVQLVINVIGDHLKPLGFSTNHNCDTQAAIENGFIKIFIAQNGSHALLRGHSLGLITLDLHEYVQNGSMPTFNSAVVSDLEETIKKKLKTKKTKSLPAIRRGEEFDVYYPTVDGRIMELDFREVVYEGRSEFQDILIMRSESQGNILILDGDLNMGETDSIYTHTLMQKKRMNYTGKTCLVLGGGDGGLLNELLLEQPQMVTMVDIDEMVIKAAKEHLRGVCFNSFDSMNGTNYEVIVGDAIDALKDYIKTGRQFDFVLYDLTAIPVSKELQKVGHTLLPRSLLELVLAQHTLRRRSQARLDLMSAFRTVDKEWEFFIETLNLALKVLPPNGIYLCQANAKLARRSLELFEELLGSIDPRLEWRRHEAFVPSFHEVHVFYEIWKSTSTSGSI